MANRVLPGTDNLINAPGKYGLEGKNVGLITNCTGLSSAHESTIDLLHKNVRLVKLFAPEHGIRNEFEAGIHFDDYIDEKTGVPVISLYGDKRRPTKEMLEGVDVLVFDIQDAGARFYTYLFTMSYAMESCAEFGLPMVVLDRPNPINCTNVEGGMLDLKFRSFIGYYPITQRYGLTIGECAKLFNEEYGIGCQLTVVPMTDYKRDMYFEDTGLMWVLPSPNLPSIESCLCFPATCIFEGTNVSEGRGTTKPFQFVGAPYIKAPELADALNALEMPGAHFRTHYFTPTFSKHKGEFCQGTELHITDRAAFNAVNTGTAMLFTIRNMYKEFEFLPPYHEGKNPMIDLNTGSDFIRTGAESLAEVISRYEKDSAAFTKIKQKYHLYD